MLIKMPELSLSEITGFTQDVDIFKRIEIGEQISNLLSSTTENLIIGIDGQWGEGKSTFSRMLSAHLANTKGIPTIYFDAFENDYQKDPFIAIAGQIHHLISESSPELKKNFKDTAIRASKAITRGALRVGLKTLSAGILTDSILDELDTSDDAATEISEGIDKLLAQKFEKAEADKNSLQSFKDSLENLVSTIGNGNPVVFIIDELDRCRPDFSLELVEQIKHLFTVRNLKFLIVTNKSQISASIQKRYGSGINPSLYLQKFIDLWISLPRIETKYTSHTRIYLYHILNKLTTNQEPINNQLTIEILLDIFSANKTSYRGIQRTLSYFAILHNSSPHPYNDHYQAISALACYSKAEDNTVIESLLQKKDPSSTIENLYKTSPAHDNYTREFTKVIIKYFSSDEATQTEMIKNKEIESRFGRIISDDAILDAVNRLNLFSTQ
ncbi:KAP family P-loop NTPase fold protein [Pseudomonas nitroreducens]|uniref:KAP family P-loop NTPase fold protein n=1 Tax=Pseudomonas nitroreducens TaxID=46680 RepID=UPI001FB7C4DA|nr:P-loop NTPase fold protein [Pseudomonas nitroreducens]MCJ1879419.1 KAP family NTPase [Pseudomonas nitroreducens]MCJ1896714.1 KAP family NTPase [Pseudomonas nitroreducens]